MIWRLAELSRRDNLGGLDDGHLADLEAGEASVSAYYGLTTQGYENLSNNIEDIKRYLSQLKSIVKYYREIDEQHEE